MDVVPPGFGANDTIAILQDVCMCRDGFVNVTDTFRCEQLGGWPAMHFFIGFFAYIYLPSIVSSSTLVLALEIMEYILYPILISITGESTADDYFLHYESAFGSIIYDIAIQSGFGIACAYYWHRVFKEQGAYPTPYFASTTGMSWGWTYAYQKRAKTVMTTFTHSAVGIVYGISALVIFFVPLTTINTGLLIWWITTASVLLVCIVFPPTQSFFMPYKGMAGAAVWTRYRAYIDGEPRLYVDAAREKKWRTRRWIYLVGITAHVILIGLAGTGWLVQWEWTRIPKNGIWVQLLWAQSIALGIDFLLWLMTGTARIYLRECLPTRTKHPNAKAHEKYLAIYTKPKDSKTPISMKPVIVGSMPEPDNLFDDVTSSLPEEDPFSTVDMLHEWDADEFVNGQHPVSTKTPPRRGTSRKTV